MKTFNVYNRFNLTPIYADGVTIIDDNGYKYLDLYGGHGVISIGHGHTKFISKITKQLYEISFYSNAVKVPIQEQLASELGKLSGYKDYQLFLCNSGAEANENAIKLASFHNEKKTVLAFKGSFHGRTAAALNITDNLSISAPINQNNFEVKFLPLNHEEAVIDAFADHEVSAVIIEGIQGVGGLNAPSAKFLEFLSDQCELNDAILILDEIQSGYGRTGKFFAHQISNIKPDIITVAKGMGNGFPIGGVLISKKIKAKVGMLGTTFGGNYLACAAGLSVLEVLKQEDLMSNVQKVSSWLIEELKKINGVRRVKGRGLMLGVEVDFEVKDLRNKLLRNHKIITGGSNNKKQLRILPPLCITKEELKPFLLALQKEIAKHEPVHFFF